MGGLGACHVQEKAVFTTTSIVSPERPLGPLAQGSVRVRTTLLGLSTNNISYVNAGTMLHWWDCFPVTPELPSPYDDREKYGIAPGWGFATVLESKTDLAPGTLLRGFFPLSSVPVDLQIKPGDAPGLWIETSPHRAKVMTIYQRYTVSKLTPATQRERDIMANEALIRTMWWSTWVLNTFSFGASKPVINPGGAGLPWSEEDADLSNALVICLAASSKTAMSLAYEMRHDRSPGSGPKRLLGVTSPSNKAFVTATGWHDSIYDYEEILQNGAKAVHDAASDASRILVVDFGARGTFSGDLRQALAMGGNVPVRFIRVGTEKTTGSPAEMKAIFERSQAVGMTQMNASGLQDQAFQEVGESAVLEQEEKAWNKFVAAGGIPGLKISWSHGVAGPDGLEGAWNRIARNEISPDELIAIWLGDDDGKKL